VPVDVRRELGGPDVIRIPLELVSLTRTGTVKIKLGRHKMTWNGKEILVTVIAG